MNTQNLPSIFDESAEGLLKRAAYMPRLVKSAFAATLGKHVDFVSNEWIPGIGTTFKNKSFYRNSLKRVHAENCTFLNCSFKRAAGPGSIWKNCQFENCDFTDSNFQFADFSGAIFHFSNTNSEKKPIGNLLKGAGFDSVNFSNASLDRVTILGCNFGRTDFSGAKIHSCKIGSSSFEGAKFRGATIIDTEINNANIEYVDFGGACLDEVYFSLLQFPFVFGLRPKDIQNNRVKISTKNKAKFPGGALPWDELLKLVPDLVSYYEQRAVFFPIANLYLLSEQYDRTREYIDLGIKVALQTTSYRDLKHLSKLARESGCYKSDELLALFYLIELYRSATTSMDQTGDLSYQSHSGEIRHYLTNSDDEQDSFSLFFKLKDEPIGSKKLAQKSFVEDFSLLLDSFGIELSWRKMEYAEHSPPLIRIVGNQNSISINDNTSVQLTELKRNCEDILHRVQHLECSKRKLDKTTLSKKAFRWQKAVALIIAANFLLSHGETLKSWYKAIKVPPKAVEIREKINKYTEVEKITIVLDGKITAKTTKGHLTIEDDELKEATNFLQQT